jgi:threonylcarbamoyladenosine tRNA methylthiotransferase MtaB
MARFTITTLGCKVNQYDSAALAAQLQRAGLCPAGRGQQADLVVINTCCVTTTAMRKSRQAVRQALRSAPNAAVLITGCYSDYDAEAIDGILTSLGGAIRQTFIAGHHRNLGAVLHQIVSGLRAGGQHQLHSPDQPKQAHVNNWDTEACVNKAAEVCVASTGGHPSIRTRRNSAVKGKAPGTRELGGIDAFPGHQRAFVKVQDGCDAFCTYCIVPYTRPVVWSRTIEQVEAESRRLVSAGHKEIVLAGVFLGSFGRDTAIRKRWKGPPEALAAMLERVARIEGLWRVRLSSLEPGDLSDQLLDVCRCTPNVAPHFHLPLQSGAPKILRRMNRQYTAGQYRRTIDRLRIALDRPAITTDIIVGFPGESNEDFARTLELVRYTGFSRIHAFPFSAIKGTAAWNWRDQAPPPQVLKDRMDQLGKLGARMAGAYRRQFVGRKMEALVESTRPIGPRSSQAAGRLCRAMTDRYLTVGFFCPTATRITGQVVTLRINAVTPEGLEGTMTADTTGQTGGIFRA